MTMEKVTYKERPDETQLNVSIGIMITTIRFNIKEIEDGYECEECHFKHKAPLTADDYSKLVAFLVRSRYSADDVEAIQLNYIENKTEKHKNEFNALKEWRSECKETARRILSIPD